MLIQYRNRFIVVFLLALLLSILVAVYLVALMASVASPNYGQIPFNAALHQTIGIIGIVALILYVWSHYFLAKAKGYSGWLALLGFLNIVGLTIIFLLPDKTATTNTPAPKTETQVQGNH